jgi:hypothetical protein
MAMSVAAMPVFVRMIMIMSVIVVMVVVRGHADALSTRARRP